MPDATDQPPSAADPPARILSLEITDLAGADVTARRLDDGSTALAISNQRHTTVTLRDAASVLRPLLDECRVAVTLLDDPDKRS
jgi:hypothetical protein